MSHKQRISSNNTHRAAHTGPVYRLSKPRRASSSWPFHFTYRPQATRLYTRHQAVYQRAAMPSGMNECRSGVVKTVRYWVRLQWLKWQIWAPRLYLGGAWHSSPFYGIFWFCNHVVCAHISLADTVGVSTIKSIAWFSGVVGRCRQKRPDIRSLWVRY